MKYIKNNPKTQCQYSNSRKTGMKMLPYAVSSVVLLQAPLQIILLNNIHLYFTVVALLFLLIENTLYGFKVKCRAIFTLVFFVLSWILVSSFMLPSILIPAIGAIDYLLPIFFWSLYFSSFKKYFSISKFCQFLVLFGVLMAILGIYQRFLDPSLFGIMTEINPYYQKTTLERVSVFRLSSFFSSTQTYSLYIGICVSLIMELWNDLDFIPLFKWFFLIILVFGGLLSGGKVFIFIFILSMLFLSIKKLKKINFKFKKNTFSSFVIAIILFFITVLIFHKFLSELFSLFMTGTNRIFLLFSEKNKFLMQESVRVKLILQIFSSDLENIFWGHGLGTASYSAYNVLGNKYIFTRFTSESYAISWWYEMGISGIVAFISFFSGIILYAFKKKTAGKVTILCLIISMFFVPTFYSVSMLPVWGVLLFPYYSRNDNSLKGESACKSVN